MLLIDITDRHAVTERHGRRADRIPATAGANATDHRAIILFRTWSILAEQRGAEEVGGSRHEGRTSRRRAEELAARTMKGRHLMCTSELGISR
jgi:hypothetical protein